MAGLILTHSGPINFCQRAFLSSNPSTINNAHDESLSSEMSTTVFGRVGVDFARSAPYLVTTLKGTGFMDLRAFFDVEDCVRGVYGH